jgi:uncharacterized protein (TIGR02271 family)
MSLFGIFDDDKLDNRTETNESGKLRLHKEELDINKREVQTGEVILSKDVVEEHKTVEVPVTHEEVVIERTVLNNEVSDSPIGSEETIRIPVSEEKIEVGKHTVVTGEVSAHKREVEEIHQVDETLRREEARIEQNGDIKITSEDPDKSFR